MRAVNRILLTGHGPEFWRVACGNVCRKAFSCGTYVNLSQNGVLYWRASAEQERPKLPYFGRSCCFECLVTLFLNGAIVSIFRGWIFRLPPCDCQSRLVVGRGDRLFRPAHLFPELTKAPRQDCLKTGRRVLLVLQQI